MKKLILFFLLVPTILFGANTVIFDKEGIPTKPSPARLVNIIQGAPQVFSGNQLNELENDLVTFSKSTGVQIAFVVVPSLNGLDKAQMATGIGHKWGVGEKGKDNGIVVLLKPKTQNSKGHVFIATGYGLEGVIPDAIGKRIVEVEMIPSFKQGDYYTGISKSIQTLKSLTLKEYSAKEYLEKTKSSSSGIGRFFPLLLFIIVFVAMLRRNSSRRHYSSSSVPFWTAMWLGGSMGRGSHGSWSDFSSGSGGFGGFGGGGFGGGGAGGSW